MDLLHVIEELQKHDPGQHREPVKVTVQALVLAHDVPASLDDARQLLPGRDRSLCLLCFSRKKSPELCVNHCLEICKGFLQFGNSPKRLRNLEDIAVSADRWNLEDVHVVDLLKPVFSIFFEDLL